MVERKETGKIPDYQTTSSWDDLENFNFEVSDEETAGYSAEDRDLFRRLVAEEAKEVARRLIFNARREKEKPTAEEAIFFKNQMVSLREYIFRKARQELRLKGKIDEKTGLYGPEIMPARYELELEKLNRARRSNKVLIYVRLDLDFFKTINDTFGHQEGDRILSELGQATLRRLRASDIAVRMSGDEFALILNDVNKDDVERVVNQIVEYIQEQVKDPNGRNISFSAGVRVIEPGAKEFFGQVDHEADRAANLAKIKGRARIEIYGPETEEQLSGKEKSDPFFEREIRHKLSRDLGQLDPGNEEDKKINSLVLKLAELMAEKNRKR